MLYIGNKKPQKCFFNGKLVSGIYTGDLLLWPPAYTITAAIDPSSSGTVTGAGQYQEGATVTLAATPADGYKFSGWQEGGSTVSTNNPYTFTATADRTFTAAFAEKAPVRLPDGYQEVEYVDFDGATHVDSALNNAFAYFGFELSIELLPASADGVIAGQYYFYSVKSGTTTYNTTTEYSVNISGGNIRLCSYCSRVRSGYTTQMKVLDLPKQSGKMKIKWDLISKTFSVNDASGTLDATYLGSYASFRNAQIGCRSRYNSAAYPTFVYDQYTSFRFYEMRTFYTDGTTTNPPTENDVQRHLIPCYRKSDGVAGLYDLQMGVFRSPTGTLSAGPAV